MIMIITRPIIRYISAVLVEVLDLWKSVHVALRYFDSRKVNGAKLMKFDGYLIFSRVFLTHGLLLIPNESLRDIIL